MDYVYRPPSVGVQRPPVAAILSKAGTTAFSFNLSESAISVSDAMTGIFAALASLASTITFSDDFSGSVVDPVKWDVMDREGDQSNSEAQGYSPGNAVVGSGKLTITGEKVSSHGHSYRSAMIQSKQAFLYGTFECSAKMPGGHGPWAALWLLGANCQQTNIDSADNAGQCSWPNAGSDEIDWIEAGMSFGSWSTMNQQIHSGANNDGGTISLGFDSSLAQHVYTLEWQPNSLVWKVDGVTTKTITGSHVPSTPMFLIVNVAMGGTGGGAITDGDLPVTLEVDYITVSQPAGDIVVSDGVRESRGVPFALSESSLSASDAVAYLFGAVENASESALSVSDALDYQSSVGSAFTFNLSESAISVSDAMTGIFATSFALAEGALSASDAMAGVFAALAASVESALSVVDDIVYQLAAQAGLTETSLSASDALAGLFATAFALSEGALSVSDQVAWAFAAKAALAETVLLSERVKYAASNSPDLAGSARWWLM